MTSRRLSSAIVSELSELLQLTIETDTTEHSTQWATLLFVYGPGRTIHPTALRVTNDETNEHRIRQLNPWILCQRYNLAIVELGKLRSRYDEIVRRGRLVFNDGSRFWWTGQSLMHLDLDIGRQQSRMMPGDMIGFEMLNKECEHFESYYQLLSATIQQAEALEEEMLHDTDTVNLAVVKDP